MLESIRGNSPLIDIVAGEKLRPGDVISARVVSREGAGRFRLIWNGRSLLADSQLNLKTGMTIRARVEGSSGALMLRLIGDAATAAAVSQGAPSGGSSLMSLLSAAMLRAGLPLPGDAEAVRQAALLERTRGPRIRMARLYSELISKGADPTAGFWKHWKPSCLIAIQEAAENINADSLVILNLPPRKSGALSRFWTSLERLTAGTVGGCSQSPVRRWETVRLI
jgi:hypothetical protein